MDSKIKSMIEEKISLANHYDRKRIEITVGNSVTAINTKQRLLMYISQVEDNVEYFNLYTVGDATEDGYKIFETTEKVESMKLNDGRILYRKELEITFTNNVVLNIFAIGE